MITLSERLQYMSDTGTVAISARVSALVASGEEVVNLGIGTPDLKTPPHVAEAAIDAIRRGETRYTSSLGYPLLREAIQLKFERDNGLKYGLDQLTIGTGGKQVLLNLLLATLNPGDEVIIPSPYYSSYPDMVRLAGGQPVILPCPKEQGFKLRPSALAQAITPRTVWLVLNSPGNPAGCVYTRAELTALADVLRLHPHVHVLADEIYEHYVFTGEAQVSFASLDEEMFHRTATINGVSKTYGMTGWRIGFAAGPAHLMKAATKVQGQSTTCPTSISQIAATHALTGPQDSVHEYHAILHRRRDEMVSQIQRVPGLQCSPPDGSIYLYVDCGGLVGRRTQDGELLHNDLDVAKYFLESAKVAAIPGVAFGLSPFLRTSFCVNEAKLDEACRRLTSAVERLRV